MNVRNTPRTKPSPQNLALLGSVCGGMSGGAAMTSDALYGTTRRLTAAGWISKGPAVANHSPFGAHPCSESAGYRARPSSRKPTYRAARYPMPSPRQRPEQQHRPHACRADCQRPDESSCVFPAECLRVMFGANNATQYVLCDLNWPVNTASNCQSKNTGTYNKAMGIDGVRPIMQFAGLPPEADVKTTTRVFVEKDGEVWYGSQDKLTNATQTRLNDIAFVPIAAQLGITVPAYPN